MSDLKIYAQVIKSLAAKPKRNVVIKFSPEGYRMALYESMPGLPGFSDRNTQEDLRTYIGYEFEIDIDQKELFTINHS